MLPTDTQKNTAYAYAKSVGIDSIEEYGLALARHFVHDVAPVEGARIEIEEYAWERVDDRRRRARPHLGAARARRCAPPRSRWMPRASTSIGGLQGPRHAQVHRLASSRASSRDEYTTLPETHDRVMATSLVARWRFGRRPSVDWDAVVRGASRRSCCASSRPCTRSRCSRRSGTWAGRCSRRCREIVEIRLAAPNKHHFLVDLAPFGLENPGEVFVAADRPYGLIEATVMRDDAPDAGSAWDAVAGLA